MYRDVEEILTRELREVADQVTVPALPELPSAPPPRVAWQPLLVAAALVLVALATVASLLRVDGGRSPQPAPQPTNVVTDDATDAVPESVPTDPPSVPYLLDGTVHVAGGSFTEGLGALQGTDAGWIALDLQSGRWRWSNGAVVQDVTTGQIPQSPGISPNGAFVAYVDGRGEVKGFETAPDGEGMGVPAEVPAQDDDGVPTRIGAVTDNGWVVASGYGVGVLWRPFDTGADVVDLTQTAPEQMVLQGTRAGLVVVDTSDGARDGTNGRVYLADITPDGEIAPIADLPNFDYLDASGDWVVHVPAGRLGGEVTSYGSLEVQRIDGSDRGRLLAPDGWQFVNGQGAFTFEDNQFLVGRVTDGQRERMVRCSPELQECVLLDTP